MKTISEREKKSSGYLGVWGRGFFAKGSLPYKAFHYKPVAATGAA